MRPPSSTETLPKTIGHSNQLLMDHHTTDSVMTADISSLAYRGRPKSTSTLTSINVLSPIVWIVRAPNVSNAIISLITSSMSCQGCAKDVSWKTVFSAKHSNHAESVMKIQTTSSTVLQGSAKPVC